jgi:DNA mismatch repair protein MutS2
MGGIHDIRQEVGTARIGRTLPGEDLFRIAECLQTAGEIHEFFKEFGADYPVLKERMDLLVVLPRIIQSIFSAIGPGGEVLDQASPKLHNLRTQARTLQNRVKDRLDSIVKSSDNQKYLQENIVTVRNGRYVIPVKQEYKSIFPGIVHDQSSSGATLFIEPMAVMEANNQLRQVEAEAEEEVFRILAQLSSQVGAAAQSIQINIEILKALDLIVAKARLSLEMDGIEPSLNHHGIIRLRGARHPLLTGDVVPIDLDLGDTFSTLVITGPNTGGKTVSLKTVGLLVLMAQSGMHVPAKAGTELSVFAGVFSDIGDEQSIEQSLSTFSSHMSQIVTILSNADSLNHLVLLDELGAGTDPAEGAALAMSILSILHQCGVRTIATTHYSELKAFAYNTPGVQNASVEFDIETLRPTYRLMIGTPGHSNAFAIASRLGLSAAVIDRAREILSPDHLRVEELIGQIVADKKKLEEDSRIASQLRSRLEKEKVEYEKALIQIKNEREQVAKQAREEARTLVFETRREMEEIIQELRDAPPVEQRKIVNNVRYKLKSSLERLEDKPDPSTFGDSSAEFAVGDEVEVFQTGGTGVVIAINGNEAQVQLGTMKVWISREKIRHRKSKNLKEKKKPTTVPSGVGNLGKEKVETISAELDLRGYTVEDALMEVDKYLDEAFLAGLAKVRLIHGKGTGALRSAIGEYLRKHPHVQKQRWGEDNEGGMGVTIVDLTQ